MTSESIWTTYWRSTFFLSLAFGSRENDMYLYYFDRFSSRVNGLHCILITDRDGVPLVRSVTERAPQLALRPNFISTFGMATDQASKLGLGRNKTIISMYSSYQVKFLCYLNICLYIFDRLDIGSKAIILRKLSENHWPIMSDSNCLSGITYYILGNINL